MKKLYFLLVATLVAFTANAQEIINDYSFEGYTVGALSADNTPHDPAKTYPKFIINTGNGDGSWSAEIIDNASEANTGNKCLKVTYTNDPVVPTVNYNMNLIALSDGESLTDGVTYVVSYYVKASAAMQASTIRVANSNWGGDDTQKKWHGGADVSSPVNTWRKIEFDYTPDGSFAYANAVGVGVQPIVTPTQVSDAGGSIILHIDDMSIVEKGTTDISAGSVQDATVFASNNILYVKDVVAATSQVKIYNLSGVVVAEDEFVGSEYTKTLDLAKGLYIVKVGTQTTKVMVK